MIKIRKTFDSAYLEDQKLTLEMTIACSCLLPPCHAYTIAEVADADTICKDCGAATVPGDGSSRCSACWQHLRDSA